MKTVMITGVAGFIGAHTLEHILENTNWKIVGVDSLRHRGNFRRVKQVFSKNPRWEARFVFYRVNLATDPILYKGKVDYIINLAAESHVQRSIDDPVPFVKNNVDLMLNVLEYARNQKRLKAFVQISTDEVYGPMIGNRPHPEWDVIVPSNPYSASKAAQEDLAIAYWRSYGLPVIITNTMNNIGEMQDAEKFVPNTMQKIISGAVVQVHGSRSDIGSRFYLHARNHADAVLFLLQNTKPILFGRHALLPDRYNIVGNRQVSNLEMAQLIADKLSIKLKYKLVDFHTTRPGHDPHYGLDGTKLSCLGWQAKVGFEESLDNLIDWTLTHPGWLT